MTLQWKHPFTSIVAGPTSCGKSYFVSKCLENIKSMVDQDITEIVWCYGETQPLHDKLKLKVQLKFLEGLPDLNDVASEFNLQHVS
jgi:hypothetical protein